MQIRLAGVPDTSVDEMVRFLTRNKRSPIPPLHVGGIVKGDYVLEEANGTKTPYVVTLGVMAYSEENERNVEAFMARPDVQDMLRQVQVLIGKLETEMVVALNIDEVQTVTMLGWEYTQAMRERFGFTKGA